MKMINQALEFLGWIFRCLHLVAEVLNPGVESLLSPLPFQLKLRPHGRFMLLPLHEFCRLLVLKHLLPLALPLRGLIEEPLREVVNRILWLRPIDLREAFSNDSADVIPLQICGVMVDILHLVL